MTLYETIDLLKKIALKHPNIGSASEGNIYEYMNANPSVKYGVFFITQGTHSQDEMFNHFEFTLFYVDRLVDDMEENRLQIQSIGKEILSNILTFFCEEFDAECENISFQPFTQRFVDETAGIYSTITIDVPKDVICPEEYWNEDWVAPVTVIRNQDKRVVFTENGTYTIDYDPTTYTGLGNVEVDVNIDVDSYYNNGYNQGKTDGVNEQKSKLETINITENGTYTKQDGYNHIEVNVPDLNGSYDEGYQQGHTEGYNEGYTEGEGIGDNQGQSDIAAKARVLDVTENGNYLSKFSDPIMPTTITGVYADGTEFYNYAELTNKVFNTNIPATMNSRVELWYKGDNLCNSEGWDAIIGAGNIDNSNVFEIIYWQKNNNEIRAQIGSYSINTNWDENKWHHVILSMADGFIVDGVKIGDMQSNSSTPNGNFFINGIAHNISNSNLRNANGYFGMIKIDDTIIIPTADGFLNTNTGELLEVVKDGSYTYTEGQVKYGEGELYKTINVNVIPKINLQKEGIKLSYGTFTEIPKWVDLKGITDMSNMFYNCNNLQTIPEIDTSIVSNMSFMFYDCDNLQTIPLLDTSKVSNANDMFHYCRSLKTLPNNFNFGICTNLSAMFYSSGLTDYSFLETWVINPNANMDEMIDNTNTTYVPAIPCVGNSNYQQSAIFWAYGDFSKLTYFGGWIGRKYNVDRDYILKKMPNLTYESCISILNNLYDFTGNGETPDSNQGKLKVHQNFLTTVGEDISIGTNKGWTITA